MTLFASPGPQKVSFASSVDPINLGISWTMCSFLAIFETKLAIKEEVNFIAQKERFYILSKKSEDIFWGSSKLKKLNQLSLNKKSSHYKELNMDLTFHLC